MPVEMLHQSASRIARIARRDLQFDVPARPRLCDGLVVVPLNRGLLLEGAPERQLLEGGAARQLLPRLFPLLDGGRSHGVLAQLLGISESAVFQAVALLYSCGVIEHGEDADIDRPTDEIDRFLSRSVDSTRVNRNGREARRRLEDAVIDIRGEEPAVSLLRTLLHSSCIRTIRHSDIGPDPDATLVVALVTTADDEVRLSMQVEDAQHRGIPVLRVAVLDDGVEVGPLFGRGIASCPACLAACRSTDRAALSSRADLHLATAIAAGEIVHLISRVGTIQSLYGIAAVRFDPWGYDTLSVPISLGCSQCGTSAAAPGAADTTSLVLTYERMVSFPPREYLTVKTHQRHYLPSNTRLERDAHQFPHARRHPLSEADALLPIEPAGAAEALDGHVSRRMAPDETEALSSLLRLAFGVRGQADRVDRWVANGANMGSPQCYLALNRAVAGVSRGVYAYDAADHALLQLPVSPEELFTAVPDTPAGNGSVTPHRDALIVMTGALDRLVRKYESFAYRIIFLDAGCVLAQLRVAGAAMGIGIAPATRWNDESLALALNIDPDGEPITGAVWLSLSTQSGDHE
jgi:SagB-type dehydrogenase family enzyme